MQTSLWVHLAVARGPKEEDKRDSALQQKSREQQRSLHRAQRITLSKKLLACWSSIDVAFCHGTGAKGRG